MRLAAHWRGSALATTSPTRPSLLHSDKRASGSDRVRVGVSRVAPWRRCRAEYRPACRQYRVRFEGALAQHLGRTHRSAMRFGPFIVAYRASAPIERPIFAHAVNTDERLSMRGVVRRNRLYDDGMPSPSLSVTMKTMFGFSVTGEPTRHRTGESLCGQSESDVHFMLLGELVEGCLADVDHHLVDLAGEGERRFVEVRDR